MSLVRLLMEMSREKNCLHPGGRRPVPFDGAARRRAAGARDPLRPPEQCRPPGELRRQALWRAAGRQERRQD